MSLTGAETTAERLPRVSPSRLEAWDRCPAAYRCAYVLRLPQPVESQVVVDSSPFVDPLVGLADRGL